MKPISLTLASELANKSSSKKQKKNTPELKNQAKLKDKYPIQITLKFKEPFWAIKD